MIKLRDILIGMVMVLSLSACEKEIVLTNERRTDRITVNAVVNPDTVVYAYIFESVDIDYYSMIVLRSDYYSYDKSLSVKEYWDLNKEKSTLVLKDAKAELIVNDRDVYAMKYDEKYLSYNSEYVPLHGDNIKIRVNSKSNPLSDGSVLSLDQVEAELQLPSTTPRIEVVSMDVMYKKREYVDAVEWDGDTVKITDLHGADTVMNIKVKIIDPGKEQNFYRLVVRSVGQVRTPEAAIADYICTDAFKSNDILFYDSDLVSSYGFIPANFTNVFDDELINGQEYQFTVESRMRARSEITPYVIVELQHLSPDLYYFLKDIEVFRISDFDLYTYPIQIWSNVKGGWGVFGAMTYDTHIISF